MGNSDGTIKVFNVGTSGTPRGKLPTAEGKATVKDASTCDLGVKFSGLQPFDAPYQGWDTDYETYSIVISCIPILNALGQSDIWILSRVPNLPTETRDALLKKLEDNGFDYSDKRFQVHTADCHYYPSEQRVAVSVQAGSSICPPKGFDSIQTFDLAKYASQPWYIQQQAATIYLPENQNYCVSARYTILEKKTLLGYDVKVRNVAYEKSGKIHDSGDLIYAKIVDAKTGKLEVAPSFLPTVFSGDYWVIDYDEQDGYALISGGAPKMEGENGLCRAGSGVNDAGLWIFTRQQARDDALVQKVRSIAQKKGFDLTVLNDVDQSSCPPLPQNDMVMV